MAYPARSNKRYASHTKIFLTSGQENNSEKVKKLPDSPFGKRLREVFGGAKNKEIAEKLGVTPQQVTSYMKGSTTPTADGLVKISKITNCSLNYLLTGEGESDQDSIDLDENDLAFIRILAEHEGISIDGMVRSLVQEALRRRGGLIFSDYKKLTATEIYRLAALVLGEEQRKGGKNSH